MKIKIAAAIISVSFLSKFSNYEFIPKSKVVSTEQPSEGERLIAKQDCANCHKIDKKAIGPTYLDIAKKYPMNDKNINYLSDKIIKGSSGVWGAIPMAPHSALKKGEAKKIATYILSLNK
jgi:cytochrome c